MADSAAVLLTCAGCFALTVVSAVAPWINAEIVLLSFTTTASSPGMMAAFVIVAAAGQMTGKMALYAAGYRGSRAPSERMARILGTWRPRCEANPWRADWLVLVSSTIGIPPFIATSLLAGALRMRIARFVVAGSVGRLIRFGALALASDALAALF
jgi:membrane protein YqaA with SNARE-associated domain